MKKIIFTKPDGSLAVVHPYINTHTKVDGQIVPIPEDITEEEAVNRAISKLPPDAINPQVVDESVIPSDRTFRNAWAAAEGRVVHDMAKCRELHATYLRTLRKPLLEAADIEFMRALEQGLSTTEIVARKQALRDVTADPAIAEAKTPEELKAVIPAILKA